MGTVSFSPEVRTGLFTWASTGTRDPVFHAQVPAAPGKCLDSAPAGPHWPVPRQWPQRSPRPGVGWRGDAGCSQWGGRPLWQYGAQELRSHSCLSRTNRTFQLLFHFREDTRGPRQRQRPSCTSPDADTGRAVLVAGREGPGGGRRGLLLPPRPPAVPAGAVRRPLLSPSR